LGHAPGAHGEEAAQKRAGFVKAYGCAGVHSALYQTTAGYDAQGWIERLNTNSDHRALPEKRRLALFGAIEDAINAFGGRYTVTNTSILCLGRKP
jgi:hypothetical protein